jgi:hypothetical protein
MLSFRRSSLLLALLAYLVAQAAPAIAGTYAALCDGRRRCNVSISEGQLITPTLNLSRERILSCNRLVGAPRPTSAWEWLALFCSGCRD